MTTQELVERLETQQRRPRRGWSMAVAAFVAVLAAGAVVVFIAAGDGAPPADAPQPTTTESLPAEPAIEEPAALVELRVAVNAGEVAAAAAVHVDGRGCDRFFTTGAETCADWYAFLVGIGTRVTAAHCDNWTGDEAVSCRWTVESDAHRALGIESVQWRFTSLHLDGWTSAQPDGNLFTGTQSSAALDADFWAFVSAELVRREPGLADAVASSNRVPATLNADFAALVLEAAASFADG